MLRPGQALWFSIKGGLDFKGRSRRSEFWWTTLFFILVAYALGRAEARLIPLPEDFLEIDYFEMSPVSQWVLEWRVSPFSLAWSYLMFIPLMALSVRRLHDIGRTGTLVYLYMVLFVVPPFFLQTEYEFPYILLVQELPLEPLLKTLVFASIMGGAITFYTMILAVFPSQKNENKYGPNPTVEV